MIRPALLMLILIASMAVADDAPPREPGATDPATSNPAASDSGASDSAAADRQDLILFAPQRPVVLQLRITVDRTPFRRLWQERIESAFAEVDADGDGRITPDEAARLAGMIDGSGRGATSDDLKQLATDDSTITLSAMVTHFEKAAPPIVVREEPGVSGTAIFAILDADGDRRLSLAELQGAEQLLRRRDFNDDEVITADELVEDPRARANVDLPSDRGPAGAPAPVLLLGRGAPRNEIATRGELAAALLANYDRDGDRRLTITGPSPEIVLDARTLDDLAADDAGRIGAEDLAAFYQEHVDLELPVTLGSGTVRDREPGTGRSAASFTVHRRITGDLKIEGRGLEIELRRQNRNPARNAEQEFPFADYDSDGNGYLDEAECQKAAIVAGSFAAMDADRDGKVFRQEFKAYLAHKMQAAAARLVMRVTDGGQDLFDLLDGSSDTPDRQLSIREILAAPQLIAAADRNGDGYLAGDEITQRFTIELSRAAAELADRRGIVARTNPVASKRETEDAGPAWFVAMDHNQDGDLSAREFLGPAKVFAQLDANRDGLIDATEASAAPQR